MCGKFGVIKRMKDKIRSCEVTVTIDQKSVILEEMWTSYEMQQKPCSCVPEVTCLWEWDRRHKATVVAAAEMLMDTIPRCTIQAYKGAFMAANLSQNKLETTFPRGQWWRSSWPKVIIFKELEQWYGNEYRIQKLISLSQIFLKLGVVCRKQIIFKMSQRLVHTQTVIWSLKMSILMLFSGIEHSCDVEGETIHTVEKAWLSKY